MPDDGRLYGARRGLSILYVGNGARRDQDQYEDNEYRQDCPGRFDLVAAVNLRRLARFISGAVSKADDGVNEQAGNYDEDGTTDCEHQERKLFDLLSWLGQRAEDAGHTVS